MNKEFHPLGMDHYILAFSGGKDSVACLMTLLEMGIEKSKIELWHHLVDGNEGSTLMDWPVTKDYCKKFAQAFGVPIYFSWKRGGFEREMNRKDRRTEPNYWEEPGLIVSSSGGKGGKESTRLKFPQKSPNLSVRWCSAYLKIDVCSSAITGQKRFDGKRVAVITGERAEESASRSRYKKIEPHRTSCSKRAVWSWRPVHGLKEGEVWGIMKKYGIVPHPAYRLGWGRVSCAACIFGSKDQWASLRAVDREKFESILQYEEWFGVTINQGKNVSVMANSGKPYPFEPKIAEEATSMIYKGEIFIKPEDWVHPLGAILGDNAGPE